MNRTVTGNEVYLQTTITETSKSTTRTGLHPIKLLFFIWWDTFGNLYIESLESNQIITADYSIRNRKRSQKDEQKWRQLYAISNTKSRPSNMTARRTTPWQYPMQIHGRNSNLWSTRYRYWKVYVQLILPQPINPKS